MLSEVCMRYRNVRSLRDLVRFVFNRTEGKLEVVVLMDNKSTTTIPEPHCSNLFDCNWAIEVSIETKRSNPPICAIYSDRNLYYLVL
jgi:hypothetical protein